MIPASTTSAVTANRHCKLLSLCISFLSSSICLGKCAQVLNNNQKKTHDAIFTKEFKIAPCVFIVNLFTI